MSWRASPEARTASCTTGMMNSTSLRSRSFSAVSWAKEMTATSLMTAPLLTSSEQPRSRVLPEGVVGRVGFAVGLEPLETAGIGAQVLVPDRPHPQPHADVVDRDALHQPEVRRVRPVEQDLRGD